ncbi:hypothetical protein SNARM312S_03534 [Streptomyces narbonensis]
MPSRSRTAGSAVIGEVQGARGSQAHVHGHRRRSCGAGTPSASSARSGRSARSAGPSAARRRRRGPTPGSRVSFHQYEVVRPAASPFSTSGATSRSSAHLSYAVTKALKATNRVRRTASSKSRSGVRQPEEGLLRDRARPPLRRPAGSGCPRPPGRARRCSPTSWPVGGRPHRAAPRRRCTSSSAATRPTATASAGEAQAARLREQLQGCGSSASSGAAGSRKICRGPRRAARTSSGGPPRPGGGPQRRDPGPRRRPAAERGARLAQRGGGLPRLDRLQVAKEPAEAPVVHPGVRADQHQPVGGPGPRTRPGRPAGPIPGCGRRNARRAPLQGGSGLGGPVGGARTGLHRKLAAAVHDLPQSVLAVRQEAGVQAVVGAGAAPSRPRGRGTRGGAG